MDVTIALAQINTKLGDIAANLEKHLTLADEAISAGADILIFPELSLTGYTLQDLAPTVAHYPQADDAIFRQLLHASRDLDMVAGFVDEDTRHRFFIATAYLSQCEVRHVHHKVYLPTYGMFDEARFFARGNAIQAFDTQYGRMGIAICEDFWHVSPPYLLWLDGADILLFTSACPGRGLTPGSQLESACWLEQINQTYACLFTNFVVHVNRFGYEDGSYFWGGSTVYDPHGKLLEKAPYHQEALTLVELDFDQLSKARVRMPLLRDERTALVAKELRRILASPD